MSVLLGDRKESKFEAITHSVDLHDMLIELMQNFKTRIDQLASLMTNNIRAANSIYPQNLHEYEIRRDYQNAAIVNCEQLIKELQRIVEIFDVDINLYSRYIKAIDREIGLIKRWRQRDKTIKSYLEKQGNV